MIYSPVIAFAHGVTYLYIVCASCLRCLIRFRGSCISKCLTNMARLAFWRESLDTVFPVGTCVRVQIRFFIVSGLVVCGN